MKKSRTKVVLSVVLILTGVTTFGQTEDSPEKDYVLGTFATTQLINQQTTEMFPTKSFGFKIQHRFGAFGPDESIYKQFLGLDLPANIRFGFAYPITENLYVEIGRTKFEKTIDLGAKLRLIRQTKDNSSPISFAVYSNMAINTDEFPGVDENTFYADSVTPFDYLFAHRVSYNTQLIISRKFNNSISLQFAPTFVYHNLANVGMDNYTIALPISGRIKVGLTSSILFEYSPMLNNRAESDHLDPISLGFEIGTAGHIFQLIVSSSNHIIDQHIYSNPQYDYGAGEILLGFNIKRVFWSKKQ